MRSGKQEMAEEIKLQNQENIWTIGEKETYKYLEILQADTIKQTKMKEKIERTVRRTRKLLETKLHGQKSHQKILRTILEENKKTNYDAYGLTFQRWHKQTICREKMKEED